VGASFGRRERCEEKRLLRRGAVVDVDVDVDAVMASWELAREVGRRGASEKGSWRCEGGIVRVKERFLCS